jgi:hypothetical protein
MWEGWNVGGVECGRVHDARVIPGTLTRQVRPQLPALSSHPRSGPVHCTSEPANGWLDRFVVLWQGSWS